MPVPVRAISEEEHYGHWATLVMGKAGHRLQQGRATNLYLAHQQLQHRQHQQHHQVARQLTTLDRGSDDVDNGPNTFSNTTGQSTAKVAQQAEMTGSSRVPRLPKKAE